MAATLTFAYTGRDSSGKVVKGRVDAAGEASVVSRLRTMGIAPISIEQVTGGTGLQREISFGGLFDKKVSIKDLAVMSRQLATMISAGLPLLKALTILADQSENPKLASTLDEVRSGVEEGSTFSDSLAKHPRIFPPIFVNLVRAGEVGGFLETSLDSIAKNYDKEVELKATIKSALTYPVVVLIMALLAVVGMILFIVPVFDDLFKDLGGELPLPTRILVVISQNMVWLGPLVIVAIIVGTIWWRANRHTPKFRSVWEPALLKMPVFGELFKKIAIARFTRNFGTMIGAGVPILQALSIVGSTSGNWQVEQAVQSVQDSVRQGRSIAAPLATEPIFPTMVTQMIAVGEDSGALETMLEKISDFYDSEVQSTTEALTSLIEPLMIAFLGVILGGMIVALYLPIFDVFNQI
ncbi:type II secretion system F family protein [Microcella frigidaquae]|uniref:Type IV pilus assembly protein PilC n=1 Tax=Microcella frigidaquae TaxID=424758 RepID=A0A840XH36_9MICO|nr:type II secretion system F family protein [Microcella frigidaquae]MBB5617812.1 type IV pilus assembly protein PilC [Microcella frigidaquae]NHN45474.1 type II secretion system F family protein [Microcella frigidaquae]